LKILYIEDGEINQRAMRRVVTRMGHELLQAADGAAGYLLAKTQPDLILLDIHLPDVNGLNLARRLRAENIATPIIVVTSDLINYTRESVLEAGCEDFIGKPFEPEAMAQVIDHCLTSPRVSRQQSES